MPNTGLLKGGDSWHSPCSVQGDILLRFPGGSVQDHSEQSKTLLIPDTKKHKGDKDMKQQMTKAAPTVTKRETKMPGGGFHGGKQTTTLPGGGFHGGKQTTTLPGGGFHGGKQTTTLPGGGFHAEESEREVVCRRTSPAQLCAAWCDIYADTRRRPALMTPR